MAHDLAVPTSRDLPAPAVPLHRRPAAVAVVAGGGVVGAGAREAVAEAIPTAGHGFPTATLLVNVAGALLLGLLIEALARAGDDSGPRRRLRLVLGTGFLGGFTTYSTFVVETDLLVRSGQSATALVYVAATVAGGLAATTLGIVLAALGTRGRRLILPVDPDIDPEPADGAP